MSARRPCRDGVRATQVIGKIAQLALSTEAEQTPINKEIHHFIQIISAIAFALGISFFAAALGMGQDAVTSLVFMIGIIVANVPEGLLATVTVCLTLTAKRMYTKKVMVKNLEGMQRRPFVRHRRASSPSPDAVGGLFFDFESLEDVGAVAACRRERGRGDGVSATSRHRDAVDATPRPRRGPKRLEIEEATTHVIGRRRRRRRHARTGSSPASNRRALSFPHVWFVPLQASAAKLI